MHNIEGYRAICREAERLGYPDCYKDDLKVHDLNFLMADDAPETFGWGIRATGTDIFFPGKEGYLELAYACQKYRANEFYYWYAEGRLTQISVEELIHNMIQADVYAKE